MLLALVLLLWAGGGGCLFVFALLLVSKSENATKVCALEASCSRAVAVLLAVWLYQHNALPKRARLFSRVLLWASWRHAGRSPGKRSPGHAGRQNPRFGRS